MIPAHVVVLPFRGPTFSVVLPEALVTIGSGRDALVRIADPDLASVHAEIVPSEGGRLLVRRAPPLLLNGRKVRQQILAPGDLIVVGANAISFRSGAPSADVPVATGSALPGSHPPGFSALTSELKRSLGRLRAFSERLARGASPEMLTGELLSDLLDLVGMERGALVRLAGSDAQTVGFRTTHTGLSESEVEFSRTMVARVLERDAPVLVADAAVDQHLASAPSIHDTRTRTVVAVPIRRSGEIVGALYLCDERPRAVDADALELLTFYAEQAVSLLSGAEQGRALSAQIARIECSGGLGSSVVGSSPAMRAVDELIAKVAQHDVPVLLQGQTGTGKEVVAREIHRRSNRAERPFVAVHCGAIAPELLASELFGHKKGAFTHAEQSRVGWIRSAEGGTLFLDEIGEMPLTQQVTLLRVLQDRKVTPVGEDRAYDVDFRLVCATHKNLKEETRLDRFRQDLFFRIATVTIELPPLSDRGNDVLELAQVFLRRHAEALGRPALSMSASALGALQGHRWEGNVRELEAAVRKAVVLCDGDLIDAVDLGLGSRPDPGSAGGSFVEPLHLARDAYLKEYVSRVVESCAGNRTRAAELLMVTPRTVFKYLEEL